MTKPESFISTTDYATLKNDGTATLTITLPASVAIASSTNYTLTSDVTVGTAGSSDRAQIHSSRLNKRYVTNLLSIDRSGTDPYTILVSLYRTSATNLRAVVDIRNPYGSTLTTESTAETFTFYVNTFLPPTS